MLTIFVGGIAIATWGTIRQLTPKGQLEALVPEMEELLGRFGRILYGYHVLFNRRESGWACDAAEEVKNIGPSLRLRPMGKMASHGVG